MKLILLMTAFVLLLMVQPGEEDAGRRGVAAAKQQADYFRKIKLRFKYVNLKRFSNEKLEYPHDLKLKQTDSLTYRRLFRKSRIFTSANGMSASYYAYNERPGYYQLVFAGKGHYTPDLVLFHFAPDGKLLAEQVVASSFFDAGAGRLTKSFIRNDSLLIRAELLLDERPEGTPCDSLVTTFKITASGTITRARQKNFKIKCR